MRYGWASGQAGKVLVEKRWCTSARAETVRGSAVAIVAADPVGQQQQALVDHGAHRGRGHEVFFAVRQRMFWMAWLAVLRITYSLRSSASGTMTSAPRPMKSWRMTGSQSRTAGDMGMSTSTGTLRQPSTTRPSARTERSSSCSQARREAVSLGRKTMATPYSPGGGSTMPCWLNSSRYRVSGIWIRMPAPSPISLSAPTAPRWSRFSRIFRPCWMMAWLFALDVRHEADATGVMPRSAGDTGPGGQADAAGIDGVALGCDRNRSRCLWHGALRSGPAS